MWRAWPRVGAKPDVVVRVAASVVQIQRPDPGIAAAAPAAATDRTKLIGLGVIKQVVAKSI
jgi:hypothetical protein